ELISCNVGSAPPAICTRPLAILKRYTPGIIDTTEAKPIGCKWHVRSARDGREDQADDDTGDESPGRDAGTEHAQGDPTQGVGQHAHHDRPGATRALD